MTDQNITPDGVPMRFANEAEILSNDLLANFRSLTPRADDLIKMMMHNDPNVTLIHVVSSLTMFRLLFNYGGVDAVETWGREMDAMCSGAFPYERAPQAPQQPPAPMAVGNPLLAGNAPPAPPAAPRAQPPQAAPAQPSYGAAVQRTDASAVERARQRAKATMERSGPVKGELPWGREVVQPPKTLEDVEAQESAAGEAG